MDKIARFNQGRKAKMKTRSPIKDKPLRLPGQSVAEQRGRLFEDMIETPLLLALFFVVFAGLEWWRYYSNAKFSPVLFSAAALALVLFAGFRVVRAIPKLRALRQAMEGEQAVGQFLERLREDGFQVFHDVIGSGFNVDHVLIGPSGVYTVETKTWSKPTQGNPRIVFDGQSIKVGSLEPDRDPVAQAKGQAGWLKAVLAESSGRKVNARPVILFPGWFIESTAPDQGDLWVLEPKALPAFLSNEPARLLPEDVKLLSFHLSRMIRTQEGGNKKLA